MILFQFVILAGIALVAFIFFELVRASIKDLREADTKKRQQLLLIYLSLFLLGIVVFVLNNFVFPGNFISRALWGGRISTNGSGLLPK